MLAGCQSALVYTGQATGPDVELSKAASALEEFYRSYGFTPAPAVTGSSVAPGEWDLMRGKYLVVWLGQTKKEGKIEIRIVPQRGANQASQELAEAVRTFMRTHFPSIPFELREKPELDIFR